MLVEDTRQICDYALDKIERAEVVAEPFPHIIISHLFPDAFFQDLIGNFPDRSQFQKATYAGTGHGKKTSRYQEHGFVYRNLEQHEYFHIVNDLFASEAFSRALLTKFSRALPNGFTPIPPRKHPMFKDGASNYTCVFDFQIDLPGYEIPPHRDIEEKIVTFQFFLVADDSLRNYGTLFCKPKNGKATTDRPWLARTAGRLFDKVARVLKREHGGFYRKVEQSPLGLWCGVGTTGSWLPWGLFDIPTCAPALPNHFMAFAPNHISYHAVRMDIPPECKRQERPVIRGFIRSGRDTTNWIKTANM